MLEWGITFYCFAIPATDYALTIEETIGLKQGRGKEANRIEKKINPFIKFNTGMNH